jgi:hypothetical protein
MKQAHRLVSMVGTVVHDIGMLPVDRQEADHRIALRTLEQFRFSGGNTVVMGSLTQRDDDLPFGRRVDGVIRQLLASPEDHVALCTQSID